MSIFRKGGLANFGRNLFRKQASGVNRIFSKIADGLNILGGEKVQKLVNSPVLDVVAGRYGKTGLLQGVRQGMGQIDNAKKFANAGAEVGNIFSGIADKGVNKNTIERVSKLSQSLA